MTRPNSGMDNLLARCRQDVAKNKANATLIRAANDRRDISTSDTHDRSFRYLTRQLSKCP